MNRGAKLEALQGSLGEAGSLVHSSTGLQQCRCLLFKTAVSELCQNPTGLECLGLLFEREQIPQVVDIRHFPME
jgi:hypothetical protein